MINKIVTQSAIEISKIRNRIMDDLTAKFQNKNYNRNIFDVILLSISSLFSLFSEKSVGKEISLWVATSNGEISMTRNDLNLPQIELHINTALKDHEMVAQVVDQAIINSRNEVSSVTITCPKEAFSKLDTVIRKSEFFSSEIIIVDENDVIPMITRRELRAAFPEHYGWFLSQFLTIATVKKSKSDFTLSVDSDTFFLDENSWVDSSGCQQYSYSNERFLGYKNYLKFLREFNPHTESEKKDLSFITHHTFYQRDILHDALNWYGLENEEAMIEKMTEFYRRTGVIHMCNDREIYLTYMMNFVRERLFRKRFSYLAKSRESLAFTKEEFKRYAQNYSILSAHSYL